MNSKNLKSLDYYSPIWCADVKQKLRISPTAAKIFEIESLDPIDMSDDELAEWGFKYMGSAPSVEGKMTMYKADISHAAVISSDVDFRWSHTFAFSDDFPPEVTMGDLGIRA